MLRIDFNLHSEYTLFWVGRVKFEFVTGLYQIREDVGLRASEIVSTRPDWPCRKGCDECCRRLAVVPMVSREEWEAISATLDALPEDIGKRLRQRIRESAGDSRPVTCPLLDLDSGACLIYDARPVACRGYGFYAEGRYVLGCSRIESIGQQSPDVVWGNHAALQAQLDALGPAMTLPEWQSLIEPWL